MRRNATAVPPTSLCNLYQVAWIDAENKGQVTFQSFITDKQPQKSQGEQEPLKVFQEGELTIVNHITKTWTLDG